MSEIEEKSKLSGVVELYCRQIADIEKEISFEQLAQEFSRYSVSSAKSDNVVGFYLLPKEPSETSPREIILVCR